MKSKINELLAESLKNNPIDAVLFSGGIDSSAIMYESALINPSVIGITIGVEGNNCEDIKYSNFVGKKIGCNLVSYIVSKEKVLEKVDDAVKIMKCFSPEWISSTVTLMIGVECAKDIGVKRIASGEGSDDLFGSFPFFQDFDGTDEELSYIIYKRNDDIPVMTEEVAKFYGIESVTPFREEKFKEYAKSIPLSEKMRKEDNITNKYPLRMSYKGLLPDEAIVRPQTMAFKGSGIYDIIKELENEVSDAEFENACKTLFEFKNKLEYVLFKRYIKNYEYEKSLGDSCIHCKTLIKKKHVNCDSCQTVQYNGKELKFNA